MVKMFKVVNAKFSRWSSSDGQGQLVKVRKSRRLRLSRWSIWSRRSRLDS